MVLIFFFSSRRRHTRLQGDWSSDVCSSDLIVVLYGDHKGYVGDIDAAATRVNTKQRSHEIWLLRRRVPFIVRLPHGSHAGVRHETGGHLDIAPTILALLGIDVRRSVRLGRDLSSGQPGLVGFPGGTFVTRSE